MRISDWSSDVCSSDLTENNIRHQKQNSRIDHRTAVPAKRSPEITTDRQVEQVETETVEHHSQPEQIDQGGRKGKRSRRIKQKAHISTRYDKINRNVQIGERRRNKRRNSCEPSRRRSVDRKSTRLNSRH